MWVFGFGEVAGTGSLSNIGNWTWIGASSGVGWRETDIQLIYNSHSIIVLLFEDIVCQTV